MERYKPGPAAVLSLLLPGLGQIYNGDFLRGIFWLIIAGILDRDGRSLWLALHLISASTAYRRADLKNALLQSA